MLSCSNTDAKPEVGKLASLIRASISILVVSAGTFAGSTKYGPVGERVNVAGPAATIGPTGALVAEALPTLLLAVTVRVIVDPTSEAVVV